MELNIGPLALRVRSLASGNSDEANWTDVTLAFITNRNGGKARRESAIRTGFKSEHLIDALGKDNPADTFVCPTTGQTYFGKIVQTPTGVYAVSAADVYTKSLYTTAVKEGLNQAESATLKVVPPAPADNGTQLQAA